MVDLLERVVTTARGAVGLVERIEEVVEAGEEAPVHIADLIYCGLLGIDERHSVLKIQASFDEVIQIGIILGVGCSVDGFTLWSGSFWDIRSVGAIKEI